MLGLRGILGPPSRFELEVTFNQMDLIRSKYLFSQGCLQCFIGNQCTPIYWFLDDWPFQDDHFQRLLPLYTMWHRMAAPIFILKLKWHWLQQNTRNFIMILALTRSVILTLSSLELCQEMNHPTVITIIPIIFQSIRVVIPHSCTQDDSQIIILTRNIPKVTKGSGNSEGSLLRTAVIHYIALYVCPSDLGHRNSCSFDGRCCDLMHTAAGLTLKGIAHSK